LTSRYTFVDETLHLTADLGDRAIRGRARILGPNRVSVNGEELLADRIIVATGSRPIMPEAWRCFSDRLLTTDTLFEQKTLPKRMAVLGLGGVGVELAQALARLGCDVTAFDKKTKLAGLTDETIHASLLAVLRAELAIHLGHDAELSIDDAALRVNAGGVSVAVERALVALGRRPNLDGLGLETLGAPLDEHGKPEVDPTTLQIGRLGVFLVGDLAGDRQVEHEAADEGHIAGLNACADAVKSFVRRVPLSIVFTHPNIAMIGKHHAQLDLANVAIGEASFEKQGRARLALRASGRLRVYADKTTGTLLGARAVHARRGAPGPSPRTGRRTEMHGDGPPACAVLPPDARRGAARGAPRCREEPTTGRRVRPRVRSLTESASELRISRGPRAARVATSVTRWRSGARGRAGLRRKTVTGIGHGALGIDTALGTITAVSTEP
jgi:dihydrolipoamide dehydrogenase